MTAGILIVFAGYTIASYGVVLLKGYNITLKQWIDPLDPYVWPAGKIPKIPAGQIFPGGASSVSGSNSGGSSGKSPNSLPLTPPPPVVGP